MIRANYIPAPHYFNLNMACRPLVEAFGWCVYLVGSSLEKRDYRDVDIRCILDDVEYARLFPGLSDNPAFSPLWSLMCSSISLYLSQHSGLPVDFQIQQQTEANQIEGRTKRHAIGIFLDAKLDAAPTAGEAGSKTT